jgi:hypothetical protein
MDLLQKNPFTTIKANDLNDVEINEQWVDLHENGFIDLFSPTSKIAMYILGGKGSGKTHLMRFFSYQAQMVRNKGAELDGIKRDGYFGIYFQASGLHSSRFEQLPYDKNKNTAIFIYSFDLWLAGLFLEAIEGLKRKSPELFEDEASFCSESLKLFNCTVDDSDAIKDISSLRSFVKEISKDVDIKINNAYLFGDIEIEILINRGELVFALPELVAKHSKMLSNVTFLYLADELENVGVEQQKYLNTLIREKKIPVTFRIGARRHGIKTYETLGAGEINKEGHEFEALRLDNVFSDEESYESFAIELIINRLVAANMAPAELLNRDKSDCNANKRKQYLEKIFETVDLEKILCDGALKKNSDISPLMHSFQSRLKRKKTISCSDEIIQNLSHPNNSLAELAGIHMFCQAWAKKPIDSSALLDIAKNVNEELSLYTQGKNNKISEKIDYYRNNYTASTLRAKSQNNLDQYLGLDNMLMLTKGFPRHILTVLRHIYKLEVFAGRTPFTSKESVSIKSQKLALKESSDWFHDDCVTEGVLGNDVAIALERLCEILRLEFYADKPVECSASSFTVKKSALTPYAKKVLEWAELIRVIVPAEHLRQDKNSQKLISKYHLNGLLCPRWGLPISRRGALSLSEADALSIFEPSKTDQYNKYKISFENSRYAPYAIEGQENSTGQKGFSF